jgi:hypothetical protein
MKQDSINRYCNMMEEVKLRTRVIHAFAANTTNAVYKATTIESVYLQFRKILELIAFGSLVANESVYSTVYLDYAKEWRAKRLLERLEQVNPGFYPRPIDEVPSKQSGVKIDWVDVATGFLTKDEFVELYEQSSSLIHSPNPFKPQTDYASAERRMREWDEKIRRLLNCHQIHLVGDPNIYLVHMKEADGKVHHYTFGPSAGPPGAIAT